jgi:hypothetical protein
MPVVRAVRPYRRYGRSESGIGVALQAGVLTAAIPANNTALVTGSSRNRPDEVGLTALVQGLHFKAQ